MKVVFAQLFLFCLFVQGCATDAVIQGKIMNSVLVSSEDGEEKVRMQEYVLNGYAQIVHDKDVLISFEKKFKRIYPFSDKRAVVEKEDGKLAVYNMDSEKFTALHDAFAEYTRPIHVGRNYDKVINVLMTYSSKTQGDVSLHLAKYSKPRVLKNLGGEAVIARANTEYPKFNHTYVPTFGDKAIVAFDHFLAINSLAEDNKTPVSQVISLDGEPLGPKMGFIFRGMIEGTVVPLSEVGDIPGAYFTGQKLYRPLDDHGKYLPLPESALGVMPLRDQRSKPVGWLIMFPDDKGLAAAVHWGKITEIPPSITTAPRIINYAMPEIYLTGVGHNWNFAYQGFDGKWVFDPRSTTRALNYGVGSQYLPNLDAFLAYIKLRNEEMQNIDKAASAARFKAWEDSTRAAREAEYAATLRMRSELSEGKDLCNRFQDAVRVGKEMVATYLEKCSVNDEYIFSVAEKMGIRTEYARQQRDKRAATAQFKREEERARAAERGGGGLLQHLESQNGPGISANPAGAGYDASKGSFGAQQQRYQWEKQLNQQLYNKPFDPYK